MDDDDDGVPDSPNTVSDLAAAQFVRAMGKCTLKH